MGGARINLQFTANWLWKGDLKKKNRCRPQCTLQIVFQFRPEAGSKLGKMIPAWIPCVSIWVNTALAVRYGQTPLSQTEDLWPHKLNAASAQRPSLTFQAQDGTPAYPHPHQEPQPGRTGTGLGSLSSLCSPARNPTSKEGKPDFSLVPACRAILRTAELQTLGRCCTGKRNPKVKPAPFLRGLEHPPVTRDQGNREKGPQEAAAGSQW